MQINLGSLAQLHQGDCLHRMQRLPESSVDLMICDLPYGRKTACDWDVAIDLVAFWKQVRRVLKPKGIVLHFAAQPFTTRLILSNEPWFRYPMIWRKTRPTGFQRCGARPLTDHEDILFFSPGTAASGPQNAARRTLYNPQGLQELEKPVKRKAERRIRYLGRQVWPGAEQRWTNYPRSVLDFDSVHSGVHSTQKPEALLAYLIRTYSNPGDVVLDPTMGSGSCGIAAVRAGRSFVGIELSHEFYDVAVERISVATTESNGRCTQSSSGISEMRSTERHPKIKRKASTSTGLSNSKVARRFAA